MSTTGKQNPTKVCDGFVQQKNDKKQIFYHFRVIFVREMMISQWFFFGAVFSAA